MSTSEFSQAGPTRATPTPPLPNTPLPPSDSLFAEVAERRFRERLRASIEYQWARFPYYRELCRRSRLTLADLLLIIADGAYHRLPAVVSTAFKLSKGLVESLNDLAVPGVFQVSSSTSGDPSYVYTSPDELAHITASYGRTFVSQQSKVGLAFAPSLRILRALSRRAASNEAASRFGRRAVLRMQLGLEGGLDRLDEMHVTVDVDVPKTLLNRALGRPAAIAKMPSLDVAAIVRRAERTGTAISLGGLALLLRPYLDEFREGEFSLHSLGHVAFSGGGYSGAKGTIRGARIDKPGFVARIASVFGIDTALWPTRIKDIYSFTETPAQIEGWWRPELGDFLFRPASDCRVYIVDPDTEEPLRSGRGLIKVVAPSASGRPAAANTSVLQFDTAEIVSLVADRAGVGAFASGCAHGPQPDAARTDHAVAAFTHIARYEGASASANEGCAFKAAEIAGV